MARQVTNTERVKNTGKWYITMIRKFTELLIDSTSGIGTKCINYIYGMYMENEPDNMVDCYCPFPSAQDVFESRADNKDLECPFFISRSGGV